MSIESRIASASKRRADIRHTKALSGSASKFLASFVEANLRANPNKLLAPAQAIRAFNCDLTHGFTEVTTERMREFFSVPRTHGSRQGFYDYCDRVTRANIPRAPVVPVWPAPGFVDTCLG